MMRKTQKSQLSHLGQLPYWEKAMICGLMNGRPFSSSTVMVYTLYARWFLNQYGIVSIQNLKKALMEIPPVHFSKREKLYRALCSFGKYLIDEGLLDKHFLEQVKPLRPKRHLPPRRITVSQQDIESLLIHCKKPMDFLLVSLLSSTGLRVSEAAALRLQDIDLENQTLTVKKAKWGKTRRVGLSSKLVIDIRQYLSHRPQELSHDYLFIKRDGRPVDRYGILNRLKKIGRKASVDVSPHALRRAFVTINANKGRPLPMLQIACGHSDITTTRSYCMTTEEETIKAMQQWD